MKIDKDIFTRIEKLHSELVEYFSNQPFPMVNAPLIQSIYHTEQQNALVNAQYKSKKEALQESIKEQNWSSYIYLHERPYRLQAFLTIEDRMNNKEYWSNLSSIWIDCENPYINIDVWKLLMQSDRKSSRSFMSGKDQRVLSSLESEITIYRGYVNKGEDVGISYTIDKDRAVWFSQRFGKDGKVKQITVNKSKIFAYLSGRSEDEIIYFGQK